MKQILMYTMLLLFICTSLSCNLTNILDKTEVEGQVINIVTGEPVRNVKVVIWESNFSIAVSGPGNSKRIEETTTDQDGRFRFKFAAKVNSATEYECWYDDHDRFPTAVGGDSRVSIDKNKYNEVLLTIAPAAKLRLKVNAVNCSQGDSFQWYKFSEIWTFSDTLRLQNCVSYDDLSFVTHPMSEYYFWWQVNRGGVLTDFRDTIFLEEGEERLYEVNY